MKPIVMAENLFCDRCQTSASVFGFSQPSVKVKVCREHVELLLDKHVSIFDIEAFSFLETTADIPQYEERRRTVESGLSQLDSLDSQCESDWTRTQHLIKTHSDQLFACLQRTYMEIWLRAQQRYTHIQQLLQTARSRLHQLTRNQHFSLSAEDSILDTVFNAEVADCRLYMAETLLSAFSLAPVPSAPGPNIDKELNLLLVLSASEADIAATGQIFEQTSADACKRGDFSTAIAELKQGRSFLLQYSRFSLDLPLACTLFQSALYAPTVALCQEMLQSEKSGFERLSALFYLSESLYCLKEHEKADAEIAKWFGRLAVESADSKCVQLYIQAQRLYKQGRNSEARDLHAQALQLNVLPHSYLTAYSLNDLGFLYFATKDKEKAERQWLRSCAIYEEHFPCSYDYGTCLNNLGSTYVYMNRLEEAEGPLVQAHQLLSTHFPHSKFLGLCLYNLGRLCEKKGLKEAAREKFESALPILMKHSLKWFQEETENALKRLEGP